MVMTNSSGSEITIAAICFENDLFMSYNAHEKDLLDKYLPAYFKMKQYHIKDIGRLEETINQVDEDNCDYLYLNLRRSLYEAFLIRERAAIDLPFIVFLRSVYGFSRGYTYVCPLIRGSDIIVAPSKYAAESFRRICPTACIQVIPNAIDVKVIRSSMERPKVADKKVITFMGCLVPGKGVDILIRLMHGNRRVSWGCAFEYHRTLER